MYKISDFSRITFLTVKALRYYDEEGILTPSFRNDENSYRYYSDEDFKKAQLVSLLRDMEFSIAEIKDVMSHCEKPEDLSYYLEEKKEMIERKIQKEKELIRKMNLYIKPKGMEENSMSYEITKKEINPILVATIRYQGKYKDVGNYMGELYKAVKGNAEGAPFCCYYDTEYREEADIELCIPVKKNVTDGRVGSKTLPGVKAISTIHHGSYSGLNQAYKVLMDYGNENHIKLLTPSREIYIKGPGMVFKGNENNYITEIILPYEEV